MSVELDQGKWTDQEKAQFQLRGWRDRRVGEFPPVLSCVRPADYVDDFHRGTIEFSPLWRNYAFHTVVMPEGATAKECNFTQASPNVVAIQPLGPVILQDSNLTNCAAHALVETKNCARTQAWMIRTNGDTTLQPVCSAPELLTGLEVSPVGAVGGSKDPGVVP